MSIDATISIPPGTTGSLTGSILDNGQARSVHTAVCTAGADVTAGTADIEVSQDATNWLATSISVSAGNSEATTVDGAYRFVRAVVASIADSYTPVDITAVSEAHPAVVTADAHGLTTGDIVTIASVTGADATTVNGTGITVTVLTTNTFSIPANTTGLGYTSGGTVTRTGGPGYGVGVTVHSAA